MRDQNSRSFAHLVRGESSSATPAHDIAVSECVSRAAMASFGGRERGGGFIVTTISPWAALARQRCKFRGGRLCSLRFHLQTRNSVIPPSDSSRYSILLESVEIQR